MKWIYVIFNVAEYLDDVFVKRKCQEVSFFLMWDTNDILLVIFIKKNITHDVKIAYELPAPDIKIATT